ncbi:hypothetical protein C3L33_11605, partial [Rhododendron williamsianum]
MDFHRALQLRKLTKPGGIHGTGVTGLAATIATGLGTVSEFPKYFSVHFLLWRSHALAYMEKLCPTLANGTKLVLNCSDKDVQTAVKYLQV